MVVVLNETPFGLAPTVVTATCDRPTRSTVLTVPSNWFVTQANRPAGSAARWS